MVRPLSSLCAGSGVLLLSDDRWRVRATRNQTRCAATIFDREGPLERLAAKINQK